MTHPAMHTPRTREPRPGHARARGFSIIEIMVGLAIGLATLLVIYQLYATAEGRRRTVASTSEAQNAGALALFAIERDIRSAGLGFGGVDSSDLGCTVNDTKVGGTAITLLPVRIGNGGQSLTVLTGSSNNMFAGARYTASSNGTFTMEKSNAGFQAGDLIVGTSDSNAGQCLLMEVTAGAAAPAAPSGAVGSVAPATNQLVHDRNDYTNAYTKASATPKRNSTNNTLLDGGNVNLGEGVLYSLGPTPTLNEWSLQSNQLLRRNHLNATETAGAAVAGDVLDFRAEYGFADGTGHISSWSPNQPANWSQVIAIRVAVLVRSSQFEKDEVTNALPRWANGEKEFAISGEHWKNYRYRVYESVVPLRNTIWGQMQ